MTMEVTMNKATAHYKVTINNKSVLTLGKSRALVWQRVLAKRAGAHIKHVHIKELNSR